MKLRTQMLAIAASAALICTPAMAQQANPQGQQGTPPNQGMQNAPADQSNLPQQEFSQEELERFNEARVAVEEVRDEYASKLQGIQDAGEARELQAEASEKMTEEVRDAGLEVDTYNAIAMAMRTNPELRQKLMELDS